MWFQMMAGDTWIPIVVFLFCVTSAQLNFGPDESFQLTSSATYFRPGDDVTLTCFKSRDQSDDVGARGLVFGDNNKGINWERNGRTLFTTTSNANPTLPSEDVDDVENEVTSSCRVTPGVILGRPAVTPRELEAVTCEEDVTSVRVTVKNVTISPRGDTWVCSKFPFVESNAVSLYNFVVVRGVTLTVRDHFPNDVNTGVLMTLQCQATPSSPAPRITWQMSRDGKSLPLPVGTSQGARSRGDGLGNTVVTAELSLGADPRLENATATCKASNTQQGWVLSNAVTLSVKRAPSLLLTALPSNEVEEGTEVTLRCGAHGHPRPEVTWRKAGGFLPGGLLTARTPLLRLAPARPPDTGEFVCSASNGVQPDATNSIYLKVEEPVRTLEISDENRNMEASEPGSPNEQGENEREEENGYREEKEEGEEQNYQGGGGEQETGKEVGVGTASRANLEGTREVREKNDKANMMGYDVNGNSNNTNNGNNGGTIAAVVISILAVLIACSLAFAWWYTRRRKNYMSPPSSIDRLFHHYQDRCMTAPRPGMYASRSSLRPAMHARGRAPLPPDHAHSVRGHAPLARGHTHSTRSHAPLTMDSFETTPYYLELPPAPLPPMAPPGVTNRGYGIPANNRHSSRIIGPRPLPTAQEGIYDEVPTYSYAGYDEIHHVMHDASRMTSPLDGYEIPVLREEEEEEEREKGEEEEPIYDVAHPPSCQGSLRRNVYTNEGSYSTHM